MRKAWLSAACLALGAFATASQAQTASPQAQLSNLPAPYNAANYEAGRAAFAECAACHSLTAGDEAGLGPDLHGLIGRRAASVPGFEYSSAMHRAAFVWDSSRLDAWLKDPAGYLPGNAMMFDGLSDDTERRNVIAYLMVATR